MRFWILPSCRMLVNEGTYEVTGSLLKKMDEKKNHIQDMEMITEQIDSWAGIMDDIMTSIRAATKVGGTAMATLISALYKEESLENI